MLKKKLTNFKNAKTTPRPLVKLGAVSYAYGLRSFDIRDSVTGHSVGTVEHNVPLTKRNANKQKGSVTCPTKSLAAKGTQLFDNDHIEFIKHNCHACSVVLNPVTCESTVHGDVDAPGLPHFTGVQTHHTDGFGTVRVSSVAERLSCKAKRQNLINKILSATHDEIRDMGLPLSTSLIETEEHDGPSVTLAAGGRVELPQDGGPRQCLLLRGASQRGGQILLDTDLYRYSLRSPIKNRKGQLLFRCRGVYGTCSARVVVEDSGEFVLYNKGKFGQKNKLCHSHEPQYSSQAHAIFLRELRKVAVADPFKSPQLLVLDLQESLDVFLKKV